MQGLARRLFGGASSVNPTGGPRPSLQVFPTVSMVRISVTDSGAGISKVHNMCEFYLSYSSLKISPHFPFHFVFALIGKPREAVQVDCAVQREQAAKRPRLGHRIVE